MQKAFAAETERTVERRFIENESDAAVSVQEEVADGEADALRFIAADAVGVFDRASGVVDADEGESAGAGELVELSIIRMVSGGAKSGCFTMRCRRAEG